MPTITGAQIAAAQRNPRIRSYIDVPDFYTRKGSYWVGRKTGASFSMRAKLNTERSQTQAQYQRAKTAKVQEAVHVAERVAGWSDVYLPPGASLQDVKHYVRGLLPNQRVWVVMFGTIRYDLGSPDPKLPGAESYEGWLTVLSNTPVREFPHPTRQAQLNEGIQKFDNVDQYLIRIKENNG